MRGSTAALAGALLALIVACDVGGPPKNWVSSVCSAESLLAGVVRQDDSANTARSNVGLATQAREALFGLSPWPPGERLVASLHGAIDELDRGGRASLAGQASVWHAARDRFIEHMLEVKQELERPELVEHLETCAVGVIY